MLGSNITKRQISVSTVAYDGYAIDVAFAELAEIGIGLVEPAYIKGYMIFDEADFSDAASSTLRHKLVQHGLRAAAISAHMDSGNAEAGEMMARRIRFAAGIGANYVITNATTVERRQELQRVIADNLKLAENLGVFIALENPGNGIGNLMVDGKSGSALVNSFNSKSLRMNYDTANALTCTEGAVRPETDIDYALPFMCHAHLKDVVQVDGGWRYVAIGKGELDYAAILAKLKLRPEIPLTLELPLRLKRKFHQEPERAPDLPDLIDVRLAVRSSWNCVAQAFGDMPFI